MELFKWSYYASMASVLIPMSLFFSDKSILGHRNVGVLKYLLIGSLAFDVIGYAVGKVFNHNIIIANIFFLFQILLLHRMYWKFYDKKYTNWKMITVTLVVFVNVFVVNSIFGQGLFLAQSYTWIVGSGIMLFYGVHFMDHLERYPVKMNDRDADYLALFFINLGVFFYFLFNFWVFTIDPALRSVFNEQSLVDLWAFHNLFNIIKNVAFAIGIYWTGVSSKLGSQHSFQ